MKKRFAIVFLLCIVTVFMGSAQEIIPLYNGIIPGSKTDGKYVERQHIGEDGKRYISLVSQPSLTVFVPKKGTANGAAVIILPGGGYQVLAVEHEGEELAKRFNEFGITAFVLKYRLPNDAIMTDKSMGPLQDAQQAMILIRGQAAMWKLDENRIGVVGASAGGHLAATLGTHFDQSYVPNPLKVNIRPDFLVLLYPRISFEVGVESSSAKNLLGTEFKADKMAFFSVDKQVNANTPKTFLLHASDDPVVKVEHSILFYKALIDKNVPVEMHLYQGGGHGFGLNNKTNKDDWFLRLIGWLHQNQIISKKN
ncbi:alpha/beta hydrolase [Pedobacter sp. Leaf250]|uniref:alpha/beta hydrolase n=1 Tax=Pedobacter sp. Leaf250 TaxID=2876559 RepID=UPI001E37DBC3|nr:alpha/beta hydrolase [Pedobacter sp. Leaf250]